MLVLSNSAAFLPSPGSHERTFHSKRPSQHPVRFVTSQSAPIAAGRREGLYSLAQRQTSNEWREERVNLRQHPSFNDDLYLLSSACAEVIGLVRTLEGLFGNQYVRGIFLRST